MVELILNEAQKEKLKKLKEITKKATKKELLEEAMRDESIVAFVSAMSLIYIAVTTLNLVDALVVAVPFAVAILSIIARKSTIKLLE